MTRRAAITFALSLSALAACGDTLQSTSSSGTAPPAPTTGVEAAAQAAAAARGAAPAPSRAAEVTQTSFRGDGSAMPSFGGWAGSPPGNAAAHAGFEWFETGYPGDAAANETLASAGVRPFAYVNMGELDDALAGEAHYSGPILRTSDAGSHLHLVDVTNGSWQDWLVRRADDAYRTGSRGIKWDAPPDVPPGKTRGDVNDATASVMQRIRDQHPDMKFLFNQAFDFAAGYPQFVDGIETEGLFSASSWPDAYLQPWKDPFYWGPQFDQLKSLHGRGVPVIVAEYADPWSGRAGQLYDAITAQGFVPYITNDSWNERGRGYHVNPGW